MKITHAEVQQNLAQIANRQSYTKDILFDLMAAYGRSSSSITQLRKGVNNRSDDPNAVLQKDVVYFKVYPIGTILQEKVEELEDDPLTQRYLPRYLIATDLKHMVAVDTRRTVPALSVEIKDIDSEVEFLWGWTGSEISSSGDKSESHLDRLAADKMKDLYAEIEKENLTKLAEGGANFRHDLNVFFSRLLFCLFAEDTGLFEANQFTNAIKSFTLLDGSDMGEFFKKLFKSLDSEDKTGLSTPFSDFPYVNGTIFDTSKHGIAVPEFNAQARHTLLEVTKYNWGQINPDIFGTIFQGIVDPARRDESGMDYTSESNILKVIEPLFMDDLRNEFDKAYDDVNRLGRLWDRLSRIKVFDPACGSGNFLIVSYRRLRALEHAIVARIDELKPGGIGVKLNSLIKLNNFYGIEIDDFAHELAVLSLYLAAHQMNVEFEQQFGKKLSIIPLVDIPTIVKGNAARLDWQEVCPNKPRKPEKIEQEALIDFGDPEQAELPVEKLEWDEIYLIGNPPYKGSKLQSLSQKEDFKVYFDDEEYSKNLDYIAIWFIKGSRYIAGTKAQLAFVSTNSVVQGEHVGAMFPKILDEEVEIGFAYTSFKWQNSARDNAGVTVVIIGIRNISNQSKWLYQDDIKKPVSSINSYLLPSGDVIVSKVSKPISKIPDMVFGSQPIDDGALSLTEDEAGALISSGYAEFVKKYMGSAEFIRGVNRYCLWIDANSYDHAMESDFIAERIKRVESSRLSSKRKDTQKLASTPYSFAFISYRPTSSIIVPSTSSERRDYIPIGFLDESVVVSNAANAIYDAELWLFALLQSKMHMAWIRTVCGQLETRIRYSSTLGYNTFPVPPLTDAQKDRLGASARKILMTREKHSEKTLAELYDPDKMPADLREAHDENDILVDRLYVKSGFRRDEDRLAKLFEMYESMTKRQK